MPAKIDLSLEEIVRTTHKTNRRGGARAAKVGKPNGATIAPAGGIKKSTKQAKPIGKLTSAGSAQLARESKIVVSGLPIDVNEAQIKEYFQKSIGSVKRVIITYNQHGQSRGIAQIYFGKSDLAAKAAKELNGMLVDKRPMKIEVVLDASVAPGPASAKSLSERVAYAPGHKLGKSAPLTKSSANPKAQPKSATTDKAKDAAGKRGRPVGRGRGRGGRRGAPGRPKKSAEELDQEMTDYMTGGPVNTSTNDGAGPAVAPAAGEDLGMDEIS